MKDPFFTLYIVSKNYARFLDQSIRSVLNQTFSNWELFLIDNNSDDNSFEIMNRYEGLGNIKSYKTDDWTIGRIANFVIGKSKGQFVMRLDADDFLDLRALEIFSIELRNNSNLSMIYPDYFLVDDDGNILSMERRESQPAHDSYKSIPPNGACTIWRISMLKDIGGYDEDLQAQDGLDIWIKAVSKFTGSFYYNLNLPLFYYRRHGSNLTSSPKKIINARQKIKRKNREFNKSKVLGVIPCRSRLDFVPDVWSIELPNGKNLLEQSVCDLLDSDYVTGILVTGDTLGIQSYANELSRKYKTKKINFLLRNNLADVSSPDLFKTLTSVADKVNYGDVDIFLLRFPQAPLVGSNLVDELIDTLQFENSDSACLVSKIHGTILKRGRFGVDLLSTPNNVNSFYDSYFKHTNSLFALRRHNLELNSLWGRSTSYIEGPDYADLIIDCNIALDIARKTL